MATKDTHNQAVEEGAPSNDTAEEMRRARRHSTADPTPEEMQDFDPVASGEPVWLTNRNGGTHDVPGDWVTEDEMGVVRVRGNLGYRYATDKEISATRSDQGLNDDGSPRATEGSHGANAESFSVEGSEPQTARMGTATVSATASPQKAS